MPKLPTILILLSLSVLISGVGYAKDHPPGNSKASIEKLTETSVEMANAIVLTFEEYEFFKPKPERRVYAFAKGSNVLSMTYCNPDADYGSCRCIISR
ncbi:MAG: hypothetical protein IT271_12605 [Chitinophagales bacterium]|nr:hypothetical protein [Chitinophagales bacterium]